MHYHSQRLFTVQLRVDMYMKLVKEKYKILNLHSNNVKVLEGHIPDSRY